MRITKRYGRKITLDWQSWEFMTELEKDVDVKSAEELIAESDKLAKNARALTLKDIEISKDDIKPLPSTAHTNGGKK